LLTYIFFYLFACYAYCTLTVGIVSRPIGLYLVQHCLRFADRTNNVAPVYLSVCDVCIVAKLCVKSYY